MIVRLTVGELCARVEQRGGADLAGLARLDVQRCRVQRPELDVGAVLLRQRCRSENAASETGRQRAAALTVNLSGGPSCVSLHSATTSLNCAATSVPSAVEHSSKTLRRIGAQLSEQVAGRPVEQSSSGPSQLQRTHERSV